MREQLLTALRAYYTGLIAKHKLNIENLITNSIGLADHGDLVATVSIEFESLAQYDEQLQMVDKYFKGK